LLINLTIFFIVSMIYESKACPTVVRVRGPGWGSHSPCPKDGPDNNNNSPLICIVQYVNKSLNVGNLHTFQFDILAFKVVDGIAYIQSAGPARIKITSATTSNNFLSSSILSEFNWSASISSLLIYSFDVIRIEPLFTEEDFWDGVDSPIGLIGFKRIFSSIDGSQLSSILVELKFKSISFSELISIFKVKFKMDPSIRSSTEFKKCWPFGHTQLFCRVFACSTINKSDLHFLQWNLRSIKSRSLDLTRLIVRYLFPLLFLSETRLLPNSSFKLNNYHPFRSNRLDGYGGQLLLFVRAFQ
jgi:hypothetical protein